MTSSFRVVAKNFVNTGDVPKEDFWYYRCTLCNSMVRSVPIESGGCKCGNIFIDKDMWRLHVEDFNHFEVVELVN